MKNLRETHPNWTVPNLLSVIRILVIAPFAMFFLQGDILWAVLMLAISGLSDCFDGMIARKFNQVTELGKMLDPLADKLTQGDRGGVSGGGIPDPDPGAVHFCRERAADAG